MPYKSKRAMSPFIAPNHLAERLQRLTDRELDVYRLLVRNLPTLEIARELRIAWGTAKTHRKKVNRKLGSNWRDYLPDLKRGPRLVSIP